jgi:hypothetical protein
MSFTFEPMDEATATAFPLTGGADSYGNIPERRVSDGAGIPCRRCMRMVGKGEAYLIVGLAPVHPAARLYGNRPGVSSRQTDCTPGRS